MYKIINTKEFKMKKIYLYDDNIGSVEYVQHMGNDLTIVNSARVSFGKQKEVIDAKDKKLIKYLIQNRHTSTLEHNIVTFRFKVPLFVRSQHHRHRTWSYNEISRRYTAEHLEFYEPLTFRTQHKSNRQASNDEEQINPTITKVDFGLAPVNGISASDMIKKHHQDSVDLFNKLLDHGICREQSRGILPQNLYTEYYGTCNLNNLVKFLDLRLDSHAQWEIRRVAEACRDIAKELWPEVMSHFSK
jgi:thymidylate synthase (FAD)